MPTASLVSTNSAQTFERSGDSGLPVAELSAGPLAPARAALAAYLADPASDELWNCLRLAMRDASGVVSRCPRRDSDTAIIREARQLIRDLSKSGAHDRPVSDRDLTLAQSFAGRAWPGVLAGMILSPAWQWAGAPLLSSVPDWLRCDYMAWLFAPPVRFCVPGQAACYASHTLARMEELERWVNRRPGIAAESAALEVFARQYSARPLYCSDEDLCRHAAVRGRLLSRAFRRAGENSDIAPLPRAGRQLRIGIIQNSFGPHANTYLALPSFAQLDPERFHLVLFALKTDGSAIEGDCRESAAEFFVLPADLSSQLTTLRTAGLDVLVFTSNITADCDAVTRLALHRIAPLQVVTSASPITSGFSTIDLYISGALEADEATAAQFTERLGLLPGPAQAFGFGGHPPELSAAPTRGEFGLPDDAVVFVAACDNGDITPELLRTWASVLADVPESRLLIVTPGAGIYGNGPRAGLASPELQRALAAHGVESFRLSVTDGGALSPDYLKALLSLGNIYLDACAVSRTDALVGALAAGLPVVAREGRALRTRRTGALLRTMRLSRFIAGNDQDYRELAVSLAREPWRREEIAAEIRAQMDRAPIFLDALAASEAFGDLIETAYDELVEVGSEVFRANPTAVRAAAELVENASSAESVRQILRRDPADAAARRALGLEFLHAQRTGRAVAYLLSALEGDEKNARLWLEVARALRADGQKTEAVQALEAGLRNDGSLLEGWQMLADFARDAGATDLVEEATKVAAQLEAEKSVDQCDAAPAEIDRHPDPNVFASAKA